MQGIPPRVREIEMFYRGDFQTYGSRMLATIDLITEVQARKRVGLAPPPALDFSIV